MMKTAKNIRTLEMLIEKQRKRYFNIREEERKDRYKTHRYIISRDSDPKGFAFAKQCAMCSIARMREEIAWREPILNAPQPQLL